MEEEPKVLRPTSRSKNDVGGCGCCRCARKPASAPQPSSARERLNKSILARHSREGGRALQQPQAGQSMDFAFNALTSMDDRTFVRCKAPPAFAGMTAVVQNFPSGREIFQGNAGESPLMLRSRKQVSRKVASPSKQSSRTSCPCPAPLPLAGEGWGGGTEARRRPRIAASTARSRHRNCMLDRSDARSAFAVRHARGEQHKKARAMRGLFMLPGSVVALDLALQVVLLTHALDQVELGF